MATSESQLDLPDSPPDWLDSLDNPDGSSPPWPPAFGVYFERQFKCLCGDEWTDVHDSNCNDKCPACDLEIEPRQVRELNAMTGEEA